MQTTQMITIEQTPNTRDSALVSKFTSFASAYLSNDPQGGDSSHIFAMICNTMYAVVNSNVQLPTSSSAMAQLNTFNKEQNINGWYQNDTQLIPFPPTGYPPETFSPLSIVFTQMIMSAPTDGWNPDTFSTLFNSSFNIFDLPQDSSSPNLVDGMNSTLEMMGNYNAKYPPVD